MPLTQEQRQKIYDKLKSVRGTCSVCDHMGAGNIHTDILRLPSDTGGAGHPLILTSCPKCGHARLYSAVTFGLTSLPPATPPATD